MKIYAGKNKGKARRISFQDLLIGKLKEAGFEMDNGCFCDENHSWVGVLQSTTKPSQVCVNITFNIEEDSINSVDVYETPIVTKLDEDNTKKIV
jgi:hypothetical protein